MATLREIKGRIVSITSTRKITSAMKMVSSSKLHKAQVALKNMLPYAQSLHHIMNRLLANGYAPPGVSEKRTVRRTALVVFSSDSALCGAFNTNIFRELQKALAAYRSQHVDVTLYVVGKKAFDFARREGLHVARHYEKLSGATAGEPLAALADELTDLFEKQEIDRAELIYHRFKSIGTQTLTSEPFLPLTPIAADNTAVSTATDYILEPDHKSLMTALVPQMLHLQLYTALLHSITSEHAVRMIAMQTATDNADELIDELTVAYNKSRQQAITNELLDIVGGAVNN
ncbi:MAG: ATP synthase F1 subunit gamma [Tannerella sp.]|jgi:F-type H+-transporting ATPase subunit gamma|nr:ATP synthase F1 subunit gamma [Tannerella sp.]